MASPGELRNWKVAGGVVRSDNGDVLLVENERKDRSIDWSTPGGVVDAGESFVEALTREVREETGIVVSRWRGPLYRVEVTAPELGFFLQVEAHGALDSHGEITIDDPDGIVLSAAFPVALDVGGATGISPGLCTRAPSCSSDRRCRRRSDVLVPDRWERVFPGRCPSGVTRP